MAWGCFSGEPEHCTSVSCTCRALSRAAPRDRDKICYGIYARSPLARSPCCVWSPWAVSQDEPHSWHIADTELLSEKKSPREQCQSYTTRHSELAWTSRRRSCPAIVARGDQSLKTQTSHCLRLNIGHARSTKLLLSACCCSACTQRSAAKTTRHHSLDSYRFSLYPGVAAISPSAGLGLSSAALRVLSECPAHSFRPAHGSRGPGSSPLPAFPGLVVSLRNPKHACSCSEPHPRKLRAAPRGRAGDVRHGHPEAWLHVLHRGLRHAPLQGCHRRQVPCQAGPACWPA